MANKRKRNDLSLAQKYDAVQLLIKKTPQAEVAKKLGCSQPQVSRISNMRDEICAQYLSNANPERKRQRTGKAANVEKALSEWFSVARQKDIPISGPILAAKAKDLAEKMNIDDFNPTSGWLSRWKERNTIVYKKLHGEKKDADVAAADNWSKTVLPEILQKYKAEDIYNADETGLYYRALPDGTLAAKKDQVSGSKKAMDRVTVLVACNMTGTDKRKLLVIGKSKDPRCFRGKKGLPVTYRNSKNAWMTGKLFTEWLQDFNKDMKLQGRKVVMLVDNCTAHPPTDKLENVNMMFLPPRTTSLIQPCDQGIIRNLKGHYRSQVVNKIIEDIDGTEDITANELAKKLNLLDAIHMLTKAWRNVKPVTVVNCFKKGGFSMDDRVETEEAEPLPPTGMTNDEFNTFVNHDDKLECHSLPTDEEICSAIVPPPTPTPDVSDDSEDDDDDYIIPVMASEVRSHLQRIRRYFEENSCDDFSLLYNLEDQFDKVAATNQRQRKITEFINWIP
ncbi:tigger transposable element-derived protein 4-like [Gigantopelta aegis]|uniref:tigger transposable element-derived protein 4-like n=1 Tax=Gigantopelta aegis TaxID=1735272 RepID=UPI001B888276|nr:tigger transposable element-derived protein 4-like [Gigantopelta aegis]